MVNEARFLLSHRLPLVREAQARGYEVVVVCGSGSGEQLLRERGVQVQTIALSRSGFAPFAELRAYRALRELYRDLQPDLVHHVTIKPVIYGTRAALVNRVPAVVNAVPGMGFVFTRRGYLAAIRRSFVNLLYRVALRHPNMRVIFQNSEDMAGFVAHGIIARARAVLIRGAGVDLKAFPMMAPPDDQLRFTLIGRMLTHKGVGEYVEAARLLKEEFPDWEFQLVGDVDPGNPTSLSRETLLTWQEEGVVTWLGHREDVAALLQQANIVCLPSYREGLPKTLLEASAVGRPMIATDVAGCREVVRDGVNGMLVPARDAVALAQAMRTLGLDRRARRRMGQAAHDRAVGLYAVEDVVRHTFLVYDQLLGAQPR
ncbi:MAG: glycosyltransferase family 4 protein [Pseudomonadota bacterium]